MKSGKLYKKENEENDEAYLKKKKPTSSNEIKKEKKIWKPMPTYKTRDPSRPFDWRHQI